MNRDRVAQIPQFVVVSGRDQHSPVLTLKQTAAYLGISKAHLSNVINHRVVGMPPLRYAKIGRRILIRREWADHWLETAALEPSREW